MEDRKMENRGIENQEKLKNQKQKIGKSEIK